MSDDRGHYDVGYGKPPKHTRFKKGQSGNPKGRPKGSRNFATDLDEVLSAPMTVIKNGSPKKVSSQLAALMRLMERALNGDMKALAQVVALAQLRAAEKEAQSAERSLSVNETEILERHAAKILREAGIEDVSDAAREEPDAERP
ncbi:MAG: DUF5681 domain-containing protein [Paracoccaceae bacterium]|nr:DUF5681 domain-containing protein [Paracoccaceae bacterium]